MSLSKHFLHFMIPAEVLEKVDAFRFRHRFESRSAAIIWLLQWALKQKPEVGN